ncbi:MAG: hypothetical protein ABR576_00540 [Thermoanaerobaculia bacterium]
MNSRRHAAIAAAVLSVAGAASLLFSWERWIHPFVDGGREMIVPARLADGERLYADVAYHYGPAAPWINAAAIALFGRHLAVLHAMGVAFSGLLFFSLFRLTRRAGSFLSATAGTALAVALCLGAPNGGAFLFPYSFGALFAVTGAFVALSRAAFPAKRRFDPLASAGLWLALTAKPEIGAAAAVVLLVAAVRAADRKNETLRALRLLLPALLVSLVAYAIAFAGLTWELASPEGPLALISPPEEWRNVYRLVSGLADPAGSLASLATALFLDLAILGAAAGVAAGSRRAGRWSVPEWLWLAVLAVAAVLLMLPSGAAVDDRLPPLLMPAPAAAIVASLLLLRRSLDETGRARFLLFGFAAAMGSRVLLGLTYGAYTTPYAILALPALTSASAVLVLDLLAARLPRPAPFRRAMAAVFFALALLGVARLARFFPRSASERVATSAGAVRLPSDRAFALSGALDYLGTRLRPGDDLAGFPEGGFFDFVLGARNPLRQDAVYPGHLDAAAEARLAERIEAAGPRFVLLVNQVPPGFGPRAFGKDYGVGVWDAVERNYRVAAAFGDPRPDAPPGEGPFFIRIYERR